MFPLLQGRSLRSLPLALRGAGRRGPRAASVSASCLIPVPPVASLPRFFASPTSHGQKVAKRKAPAASKLGVIPRAGSPPVAPEVNLKPGVPVAMTCGLLRRHQLNFLDEVTELKQLQFQYARRARLLEERGQARERKKAELSATQAKAKNKAAVQHQLDQLAAEEENDRRVSSQLEAEFTQIQEMQEAHHRFVELSYRVRGWVRTSRQQKNVGFVQVNDGTEFYNLQCVAEDPRLLDLVSTGCSVEIEGVVVPSTREVIIPGQEYELQIRKLSVLGESGADYPIAKKAHSPEHMRANCHLRLRSEKYSSMARLRNAATMAVHGFFQLQNYVNVHVPLITPLDCEGAGDMFEVRAGSDPLPGAKDAASSDYFFGRPSYLSVSGQLYGEMCASSLSQVYTFSPTFRAENSHTGRHLAEFWMLEPEVAHADLESLLNLAESSLKFVAAKVYQDCPSEMEYFVGQNSKERKLALEKQAKQASKGRSSSGLEAEDSATALANPGNDLVGRLGCLVTDSSFARISYTEAVQVLSGHADRFSIGAPQWGDSLALEHERWLADVYAQGPIFVTDYPAAVKPFYMLKNPDGKTVACFDLLVPGVGELIGGSVREHRLDELRANMVEHGLLKEGEDGESSPYSWYLDLRKYGSVPHGGWGMGFERLLMYLSGLSNVRDVSLVPRVPGSSNL